MNRRVVLIGATGFFGARLAGHLAKLEGIELAVTSRAQDKAETLARGLRSLSPNAAITALAFDRDQDGMEKILELKPWLVIDTTGPFQGANYDLARACVQFGAHWIDIADARDYILGFAEALDDLAKARGVCAYAGASSTPALSYAAVEDLSKTWRRVDTIDIAIFPGGGVKAGPAVIKALLSYIGRPIPVWREGTKQTVIGWSWPKPTRVAGLGRRYLSSAESADDALLSERFGVTSRVAFYASLESRLEQYGLAVLAWLRSRGVLRNLASFAPTLVRARTITGLAASDRGGMTVDVTGVDGTGLQTFSRWSLLSEKCEGAHVPVLPALALTRALLTTGLTPGAGPACGVLPLVAFESEMRPLALQTSRTFLPDSCTGLFEHACGAAYAKLQPALKAFHDPASPPVRMGRADIDAGESLLARVIAKLFGFPPSGRDVAVTVTVDRKGGRETWTRNFAGRRFSSQLTSAGDNRVAEQFGPFHIILKIVASQGEVQMPVVGWRLGHLKLPRALAPRSQTLEYQDKDGRFCFDVAISAPLIGILAHYRGWLYPRTVAGRIHPPL